VFSHLGILVTGAAERTRPHYTSPNERTP
jgi:hypothetical protein